ncbi:glycerol kinase [Limosa lapponica baueri]|uniref:Glycerol kinase n=1 Tax=Limosa lapponica baueri TaxID=1758121 RepID=A0A2I0UJZ7_LIMLA|nr:glycerol kinase [Limosa lapponica baueri]
MIKGLENLPYEERLKELEKRWLSRDLITIFQYLGGGYKEYRGSLFTRSHMVKTRGKGYKLHQETLCLET